MKFSNNAMVLRYQAEIRKYPPLTTKEERALCANFTEANKQILLHHSLGFVFDTAKKYFGRGIPEGDLINYGNIGILKAMDKFDVTRKFRFINYAKWWIEREIWYAFLEENNTPQRQHRIAQKARIIEDDFVKMGEVVTDEELAKKLNVSLKRLWECMEDIKFVNLEDEFDKGLTYSEILSDKPLIDNEIGDLLDNISDRERKIVTLVAVHEMTFSEVAEIFMLSEDRIEQIYRSAIRKLRCGEGN